MTYEMAWRGDNCSSRIRECLIKQEAKPYLDISGNPNVCSNCIAINHQGHVRMVKINHFPVCTRSVISSVFVAILLVFYKHNSQ